MDKWIVEPLHKQFYAKYGFILFPSNPHHLAVALETVEEVLGA